MIRVVKTVIQVAQGSNLNHGRGNKHNVASPCDSVAATGLLEVVRLGAAVCLRHRERREHLGPRKTTVVGHELNKHVSTRTQQ